MAKKVTFCILSILYLSNLSSANEWNKDTAWNKVCDHIKAEGGLLGGNARNWNIEINEIGYWGLSTPCEKNSTYTTVISPCVKITDNINCCDNKDAVYATDKHDYIHGKSDQQIAHWYYADKQETHITINNGTVKFIGNRDDTTIPIFFHMLAGTASDSPFHLTKGDLAFEECIFAENTSGKGLIQQTGGALSLKQVFSYRGGNNNTVGNFPYKESVSSLSTNKSLMPFNIAKYLYCNGSLMGGVVYSSGGTLTIDGSNLSYNRAVKSIAEYVTQDGENHTRKAISSNTTTSGCGGALCLVKTNTTTISGNTEFSNNTAEKFGGAIYLASKCYLKPKSDETIAFSGNSPECIYLASGSELYINGQGIVSFSDKVKGVSGSSLFIQGGTTQIRCEGCFSSFQGFLNWTNGTIEVYKNNWIAKNLDIVNGCVLDIKSSGITIENQINISSGGTIRL